MFLNLDNSTVFVSCESSINEKTSFVQADFRSNDLNNDTLNDFSIDNCFLKSSELRQSKRVKRRPESFDVLLTKEPADKIKKIRVFYFFFYFLLKI